jgi:hypothetical protein
MLKLKTLSWHLSGGTEKDQKIQDGRSPRRDLNLGPPEYKASTGSPCFGLSNNACNFQGHCCVGFLSVPFTRVYQKVPKLSRQ